MSEENNRNTKFTFDLLAITDEDFRKKAHKAFEQAFDASLSFTEMSELNLDDEADMHTLQQHQNSMLNIVQQTFRDKYNAPDADLKRIHKAWSSANSSFDYLNNNVFDAAVQKDDKYGYEWYMNLSDTDFAKLASQDESLKNQFGFTTKGDQYESIIRTNHAAAKEANELIDREAEIKAPWLSKQLMMGAALDPPYIKVAKFMGARYIQSYMTDTDKNLETLIEDLKNSNLLDESLDKYYESQAEKTSVKINKNKMKGTEDIRYIDTKNDLSVYYKMRKLAKDMENRKKVK